MLALLDEYWHQNPDLRLGQILCNLARPNPPFYLEDDVLIERLEQKNAKDPPIEP